MGQVSCPETSVWNYQSTLSKNKTLSNNLSNLQINIIFYIFSAHFFDLNSAYCSTCDSSVAVCASLCSSYDIPQPE